MKEIEEVNETIVHIKALHLMNKNGVIETRQIKTLANAFVRQIEGEYRLKDYPDSSNWNGYILNLKKKH